MRKSAPEIFVDAVDYAADLLEDIAKEWTIESPLTDFEDHLDRARRALNRAARIVRAARAREDA